MRRTVLILACSALALIACRDKSIAEVQSHKGDLTRDTAATQNKWEAASDGTKLSMGDGLHTGPSSEAVVKLTRGGTLKMPPDTTIRFLANAAANPKLAVETGEASIQAEGNEVAIETEIGTAHIEAGGTLRVAPQGLEVSFGNARIDTADGGVSLTAGKAYDIAVGGAIIERPAKTVEDASAPVAVVDAGPPIPTGTGVVVDVHGKGVMSGTGKKTELADGANDVKPGDRIVVPAGASVDVHRGAQHLHITGTSTITIGEEGGALAKVEGGRAELESAAEAVEVNVPGGSVLAKPGKSRVTIDGGPLAKVTVMSGEADLRGKTTETLRAGETATISPTGTIAQSGRTVATADLTIKAGDSIIVRDGKPPTALGVDFSAVCPGAAVFRRGDVNFRGEKRVNVPMFPGVYPYTVHCVGADGVDEKEAAKGAITVIQDAARAELPRVPPSSVVDADGRKYTILYQNHLPSILARWPEAPNGGKGASIIVDGKKQAAEGAKATLKSGSMGEGTHSLKFETADGKISPETTVVVKFDNAAPAASLREPADGSFGPTDSVKVSGLVSEGWSVSINGTAVPLDEQQRFSTTATPVAGENAIVLRLSHPQRGVVYYVRHAAGAAHP